MEVTVHVTGPVTINTTDPAVTSALSSVLNKLEEIKEITLTNQEKIDAANAAIDAVGAQLTTATTGLAADIQALKDAVAANAPVDLSGLETRLASLQAAAQALTDLDAANPPAPTP